MTNIIYIQKYIKTDDDLPKEGDVYIAHSKSKNLTSKWAYDCSKRDIITWMTYVDWYFLPVELPTGKEIKKQFPIPSEKEFDNAKHGGEATKLLIQLEENTQRIKGATWLLNKLMGK